MGTLFQLTIITPDSISPCFLFPNQFKNIFPIKYYNSHDPFLISPHAFSRTKVSSCLLPLRAVAAFSSGSVQGHKGGKKTLVSQWSQQPPAASSLLDRTFNSKTAKSYVTFPDCWIVLILWAEEEATNNLKGTATSHTSSKELDEINFDINSAWESSHCVVSFC